MANPREDKMAEAHKVFYDEGMPIRRAVAGPEYVERSLQNHASEFSRPMQEMATEVGWGMIWARPGLSRPIRSMLCIAMLCALNRSPELAVHVRGAVNNGVTETEIRETIMQAAIYAGFPAGLEGIRVAEGVLNAMQEEREARKEA
jgi:4-carboxymuconolactone decarboxylase